MLRRKGLFGDNNIDCEELTVPHKLMYERDFVMIPLKEIAGQANNDVLTRASNDVLTGAGNDVLTGASNDVLTRAGNDVIPD